MIASLIISVSSGHFPPPTTPEELGARILIQERYEKYGESEEVEMEVESEDEDDERPERNHGQPSQPDQDTQVQDMDEVSGKKLIHHCVMQIAPPKILVTCPFFHR